MEKYTNKRIYYELRDKIRKAIAVKCKGNCTDEFNKYPTLYQIKECVKEIEWDSFADTNKLSEELQKLGFFIKYCKNLSSYVIIEDPDIVFERYHYLKNKEELQVKYNTDVFYINSTWVDDSKSFETCYSLKKNATDSENRLLCISVASTTDYITSKYYNEMTEADFCKRLLDILLNLLTKPSLVIFNDAPYNRKLFNSPPSTFAPKKELILWLESNNIPYRSTMKKPDLCVLVEEFKRNKKEYEIDKTLKAYGHGVLRIPEHMIESNVITHAWTNVRDQISRRAAVTDMSTIKKTIKILMTLKSAQEWQNYHKSVNKTDQQIFEEDLCVEKSLDLLVLEEED